MPVLSRRSVMASGLATAAVAGLASLLSFRSARSAEAALAASTGCVTVDTTDETTQGPFWVDEKLNRSDIRTNSDGTDEQDGVPLSLTITLYDVSDCGPQVGAYIDIWHANAEGVYSDVSGSGNPDEKGYTWLRGYQVTDENGQVTFTTIYPGWYLSRAIHIHARVRISLDETDEDATHNFTTQMFFDEEISQQVLATSAYKSDSDERTTNSTDAIYESALQVPLSGDTSTGYTGSFQINLDFSDVEDATSTATATATATSTATATATATPTATPTATATSTGTATDADSASSGSTTTTTASDDDVDAKLLVARVARRASGRRVLVLKLRNTEKVTARVRLVRHHEVYAHKRWGWLSKRTRVFRIPVKNSMTAGHGQVLLTLADAAGNIKIIRRVVHIPAR
ncbi:MAG: intradiol ring-cleavage dioxygenase [Microbacteriaceae bacterium]